MQTGTLYIIASPIGNLEDITIRALNILKTGVNLVCCEDTRQTKKLLVHYGIDLPLRALHAHSAQGAIDSSIRLLKEGKSIAYLTDSGTPGISDPGSKLVNHTREQGIPVIPIPGPSALTSIVSVCGFPEKSIMFTGFLSKKEGKIRRELERLMNYEGIIVMYESPYRIKKLITIINDLYPTAHMIIGREMTKFFEEFIAGTVSEVYGRLDSLTEKGEFTIALIKD